MFAAVYVDGFSSPGPAGEGSAPDVNRPRRHGLSTGRVRRGHTAADPRAAIDACQPQPPHMRVELPAVADPADPNALWWAAPAARDARQPAAGAASAMDRRPPHHDRRH